MKSAFFYLFFAQKHRLFVQKIRAPGVSRPGNVAGTARKSRLFSFYGEKVMKSG
jgi:hypothetical protein